jgi:hypothetical protein
MRIQLFYFGFVTVVLLGGCIGDDLVFDTVDPVIRISNPIDTIAIDSQYQFNYTYFNNIGVEETISSATWSSSFPDVIEVSQSGLARALAAGVSTIEVQTMDALGGIVRDMFDVAVGKRTVIQTMERHGELRTTSSYTLKGLFSMQEVDGSLKLCLDSTYQASSNLPGLYVYLTNNPNSIQNATEIGMVTIFNGAHEYDIPQTVEINDFEYLLYYCKPFNVKVGDGTFEN